ncbi:hypothetical protein E2C01_042248 [Portunus trituberculatus]|uniref:Uncharacterized protein n=1 Tax=Portunus trituberculatus TaxID=210409 RepID=A0A5B7FT46_PORTR|nr:hypothetical protein [Portunus trituberculatus]
MDLQHHHHHHQQQQLQQKQQPAVYTLCSVGDACWPPYCPHRLHLPLPPHHLPSKPFCHAFAAFRGTIALPRWHSYFVSATVPPHFRNTLYHHSCLLHHLSFSSSSSSSS